MEKQGFPRDSFGTLLRLYFLCLAISAVPCLAGFLPEGADADIAGLLFLKL